MIKGAVMKEQRGVTLIGLVVACVVVIFVAIGGLKIAPAYIEYHNVKKAIVGVAQTTSRGTVLEVRQAFNRRAVIDDIDVIEGKDLEVTKEGNDLVISFSYSKRIPIFANISVVIDFAASSNG
jgi:Tfp pilus assembly protein PilE